mmetsp:Transcript_77517/g.250814  ORF Transcript_77517/g.250814 Transcript_77517/m.250814 type:complete len:271 (-) Transcript_77517:2136-2948(-)
MMLRQCASLHSKPSLMMDSFFSIIRPMASSTGLPKKVPTCFCCVTRKCSSLLPVFSLIPSASSRTDCESKQLASRLSVFSVVFTRSEAASSMPWVFMRFVFESERVSMCVFVSMAFTSFGAIRASMWGGGMCMLLKLKSVSAGSLRCARCTIQIIQSPYSFVLEGSARSSATSVTASIFAAKSLLMEPATSSLRRVSTICMVSCVSAEPEAFFAVMRYVTSSSETSTGEPLITPVFGSSSRPSGSAGSAVKVQPMHASSSGSISTGSPAA